MSAPVAVVAQPPGISTPSRPRPSTGRIDSLSSTAGNAPATAPHEGYSYLARSNSISTPTRSRPKGLSSTSNSNISSPVLANRPSLTDLKQQSAAAASPLAARDFSRRKTMHTMPYSVSMPLFPEPVKDEAARIVEAVSKLPANPKAWTPSQVALYLSHVLGLVPRPVVEDVTAYVRSSRMGGRAFLRLSEKDLELQGLNLKWRRLMIEAVRKLRRDALRGRIWGNETGSVKWPRKHDFDFDSKSPEKDDQEEEEEEGDEAGVTKDGVVRLSKDVSKLTLKRMRESKKVQGMIQAFQLSPRSQDRMGLSEQDLAVLGIDQIRKGHVATRGGSNGSDEIGSLRAQIPPVFGHGYVRDQAESYESASDAENTADSARSTRFRTSSALARLRRSNDDEGGKGDGKGDIFDDLLASVSDHEAAELASELGLEDLRDPDRSGGSIAKVAFRSSGGQSDDCYEDEDNVALVPCLDRHPQGGKVRNGSDGSTAEDSLYSGTSDSEIEMEDLLRLEQNESRFGLLDADVIKSIMGEASVDADGSSEAVGDIAASSGLTRSRTTGSIARQGRPYRASLYTTEELLLLDSTDSQLSSHLRTESSAELAGALGLETDEHDFLASPKFDTAKKRPVSHAAAPETTRIEGLFSPTAAAEAADASVTGETATDEYIFDPPAASLAPPRSQPASVRKKLQDTHGSKRGKALLSMLQSAIDENDPSLLDLGPLLASSATGSVRLRKKRSAHGAAATAAQDKEGWGGTLSRPLSRKSLSSIYMGSEETMSANAGAGSAASRIGSVAVRRRPLERVASEAEAEAWHEALDKDQAQQTEEAEEEEKVVVEEVIKPLDRYEETKSVDEEEHTILQKPSVERRLTDLFGGQAEVVHEADEQDDGEAAAPAVVAETEKAPAVPVEAREEEQHGAQRSDDVVVDKPIDEAEMTAPEAVTTVEATFPPPYEALVPVPDEVAPPIDTVPSISVEPTTDAYDPTTSTTVASADAVIDSTATSQILVPLTTLTPHPSGSGSIRKRSMVLVDRKRFESLARKMEALESQITTLESQHQAPGSSGLRDLFSPIPTCPSLDQDHPVHAPAPASRLQEDKAEEEEEETKKFSLFHPSSWTRYLSSLNPYYNSSTTFEEDRVEPTPEEALSLGAIPAYMLGLGAGVGFVVLKEVVELGVAARR